MGSTRPKISFARLCVIGFSVWFIALNLLSHGNKFHPPGTFAFDIPHFDKILHFGYFGIGGFLLAGILSLLRKVEGRKLLLIATVTLSVIGVYDEFHQSFFENRTGNDPGDWLADTLGGFCGALAWLKLSPWLLRKINKRY